MSYDTSRPNNSENSTEKAYRGNIIISFENLGKSSRAILEMYLDLNMRDDVKQKAWNLCDCDDEELNQKFGNFELESSYIQETENEVNIVARFRVMSSSETFIHKVISDYVDGFDDWISNMKLGYYSRTGQGRNLSFYPKSWNVEIKVEDSSINYQN